MPTSSGISALLTLGALGELLCFVAIPLVFCREIHRILRFLRRYFPIRYVGMFAAVYCLSGPVDYIDFWIRRTSRVAPCSIFIPPIAPRASVFSILTFSPRARRCPIPPPCRIRGLMDAEILSSLTRLGFCLFHILVFVRIDCSFATPSRVYSFGVFSFGLLSFDIFSFGVLAFSFFIS